MDVAYMNRKEIYRAPVIESLFLKVGLLFVEEGEGNKDDRRD